MRTRSIQRLLSANSILSLDRSCESLGKSLAKAKRALDDSEWLLNLCPARSFCGLDQIIEPCFRCICELTTFNGFHGVPHLRLAVLEFTALFHPRMGRISIHKAFFVMEMILCRVDFVLLGCRASPPSGPDLMRRLHRCDSTSQRTTDCLWPQSAFRDLTISSCSIASVILGRRPGIGRASVVPRR